MSEWQSHVDPDSGSTYYYNTTTGVTQWEVPEGFESQPEAAAPASAGSVWQELYDEASQASYYYNSETGETTWDRPAELDAAAADAGAPAAEAEQTSTAATATTAAATTQSTSHRRSTISRKAVQQTPQSVSEKLAARAKKYIQMRRVEKGGSSAAFTMGDTAGGLDASASGRNADAGDTSAAAGASDWQAAVDEASGATYYYNTVTGETQWEAPAGWSG